MKKVFLTFLSMAFLLTTIMGCDDDKKSAADKAFAAADGINGGQFYDEFWASETGFNQSDPNIGTFDSFSNFFRCKQCHGWDLIGNQGAYISRAPSTSRPNVTAIDMWNVIQSHSKSELFEAIKTGENPAIRRGPTADLSTYDPSSNSTVGDQMPNYGAILTDAQIWDMVKFLKEEAINVDDLYNFTLTGSYPTGDIDYTSIGQNGDATAGDTYYTASCAGCHGADGTTLDLGGRSAGEFIREKPNEAQHKIKFGQLGTGMINLGPSMTDMINVYKALTNATKYPDL